MKRLLIKVAITLGALLVLSAGPILISIMPKLMNMKSEYDTATVIKKTDTFVRGHPGQWPRSWADLGLGNQDNLTTMNFALNPTNATMSDVVASIQPRNGRYYTFPHAKRMLEGVYSALTNGL